MTFSFWVLLAIVLLMAIIILIGIILLKMDGYK